MFDGFLTPFSSELGKRIVILLSLNKTFAVRDMSALSMCMTYTVSNFA
jgi:hypothetical protein